MLSHNIAAFCKDGKVILIGGEWRPLGKKKGQKQVDPEQLHYAGIWISQTSPSSLSSFVKM